jgi:hypothetical protein
MPALTRDAVLAAAKTAFASSDPHGIVAILDLYGAQPYELERERVQLAIIELSRGDRATLERLVKMAKVDYRDVLAMQELGPLSAAEGEKLQAAARAVIEKWGRK